MTTSAILNTTPEAGVNQPVALEQVEALTQQVAQLMQANAALQAELADHLRAEEHLRARQELLEHVLALAHATAKRPTLKETLQNILTATVTLTQAERGSIFLLDAQHRVVESFLGDEWVMHPADKLNVPRVMEQGLANWVLTYREAALVTDTLTDPRWLTLPGPTRAVRSVLAMPIQAVGRVLGIVFLFSTQPHCFNKTQLDFMWAATHHMTLAIQNAQLYEHQQRLAWEQHIMYEVLRAIAQELDPYRGARVAVRTIATLTGWSRVSIEMSSLPTSNSPFSDWAISISHSAEGTSGLATPLNEGLMRRIVATGQTQLLRYTSAAGNTSETVQPMSELAVPLRRSGQVVGMLHLESEQENTFTASDVALAEALAEAVALALHTAQLYADAQRELAERQLAEAKVLALNADLQRSNADLEQFAYIASHDLQEPLRMVTRYNQLLAKQYAGRLDSEAQEYIHYAVDGAHRMSTLIRALLEYARVGRNMDVAPTSLQDALTTALSNLHFALEDVGGEVRCEPKVLPVVRGNAEMLALLLQNLINNALKFRRPEAPPRVSIRASVEVASSTEWRLAVTDNGIGIAAEHYDRIFTLFQRLHTRDEYPGTGIGLAICKKIVERHGGRMWVESQVGQGTTFYFTLRAAQSVTD